MAKKIPIIECDEKRATSITQFKQVAENIAIWQSLTHHSYAENTLVAFKNDWNHFLIFCEKNKVSPLPATAETVHRFIEKMAESRKLA